MGENYNPPAEHQLDHLGDLAASGAELELGGPGKALSAIPYFHLKLLSATKKLQNPQAATKASRSQIR